MFNIKSYRSRGSEKVKSQSSAKFKRYPVTSPPSRLATSELATKERSRHQRTRHQAKSSRHQPPIKRLVEESRMFGW